MDLSRSGFQDRLLIFFLGQDKHYVGCGPGAQNDGYTGEDGFELYVAPESRFKKPEKNNNDINYNHLVVLVKNRLIFLLLKKRY